MANVEIVTMKDNKATFVLKKSTPGYANALRRIMLMEVPVMAIEDVEIRKNSSAMYDEVLTHRLGLLSLTTDLKSYELPKTKADVEEKNAKCTLEIVLKEKGPKTVYASDLKSKDPKVKPVFGKTPIVKLLKDQELELVATAVIGIGKEHSKWSPAHVWYTYNPTIKVGKVKDLEKYKEMYPPQIFNKKGEIDEKLILDNDLVDAVANVNNDVIKVEYDETEFIFKVESWGQLAPKEIVSEALSVFNAKLDALNKSL